MTISEKLFDLCRSEISVSSELTKNPSESPGSIAARLYGSNSLVAVKARPLPKHREVATAEDLHRASLCGRFADTKPSELFLRAYHDILCTLEADPVAGVVSPSLVGSTGTVPLTVMGSLHDIVRHWSNLIVRAKSEVLLATNFWKASGASELITDALLELSNRAGDRGDRVVVKLMYDRGNVRQFIDPHYSTPPSVYSGKAVQIPTPEQVPNLDLAVVNYHKPLLGTFHAKFMIVDREFAVLTSNNIQDNDNLEMMSQLEGPIVDSVWDTFVISWHNAMSPPAPCVAGPAAGKSMPSFEQDSFKHLFNANGAFRVPEKLPPRDDLVAHVPGDPHYDQDVASEIARAHSMLSMSGEETHIEAVARHLNATTKQNLKPTAPPKNEASLNFFPIIPTPPTNKVPMAMVSRRPTGSPLHDHVYLPQNEAWISLFNNAKREIFIQTPDLNAKPLLPVLVHAVRRGVEVTCYLCLGYNDAGELLPGQGGTNEMFAKQLYDELRAAPQSSGHHHGSNTTEAQHGSTSQQELLSRLRIFFYTAYDQDHPIHNSFKRRSCHIKLALVDGQVAVQGSGNQDTQSWYQSQEVNVMIDSEAVCRSWREGIERNQNTRQYGRLSEDGCWYDKEGKIAPGSEKYPFAIAIEDYTDGPLPHLGYGTNPGHLAVVKGVWGTFQKARGA